MRRLLNSAALAVLMSAGPSHAQAEPAAVASIVAERSVGGVRLSARVLALGAGDFDARMRIEKSGPSGRLSTTQGGAAKLEAGGEGVVATVGLSMAPGDTLSVDLVVSSGGRDVAHSRLTVGE